MFRPSDRAIEQALDDGEARLERACSLAVRDFITTTRDEAIASLPATELVAAAVPSRGALALGELVGWWTAAVAERINPVVEAVWLAGYRTLRPDGSRILSTTLDSLATYMAAVSDRLVRGLQPPLPDNAFNVVRAVITGSAAQGWSTSQTAERIAKELSWETDGRYWRGRLEAANQAIDSILDPLGPPGSPAREAARLNDARVAALQAERASAVRHLDAEQSVWKTRATLIARTESTGAYNAGALVALGDEGARCKEWLATSDQRTRPNHAAVNGTVIPVAEPFIVGGAELMMPGDPTGPASEVCNCRCALVGADC